MTDPSSDVIRITSIEAARNQLATAIQLWFEEKDPVSIHTLAHSSYETIHALSKKVRKGGLMYDSEYIKDTYRKKINDLLRMPGNFFKHPARDGKKDRFIDFRPKITEMFFLSSLRGLEMMGEKFSDTEAAFYWWFAIHNPDVLNKEWRELFTNQIPVDSLLYVRNLKKGDFLHEFIGLRRSVRTMN